MEARSIEHKLGVACSVSQADELVIWRLRLQVWWLRLLAVEQLAARALFEGPACLEGAKREKQGGAPSDDGFTTALLLLYLREKKGGAPSGDGFIDFLLLCNCFTTALLLLYYCFTKAVEEGERVRQQVVHIFRYYST